MNGIKEFDFHLTHFWYSHRFTASQTRVIWMRSLVPISCLALMTPQLKDLMVTLEQINDHLTTRAVEVEVQAMQIFYFYSSFIEDNRSETIFWQKQTDIQYRIEVNWTEQNRSGKIQNRIEQNRTKQNTTKQNKTKRNKTERSIK